ncbi:hypothetical protein LZP73_19010 [Shewanella sp. AS16]|uniref:hypothetical protein n=1 Tax=Shewanella sp. AS16 TaxID=2907625 RepID=UPI001F30FF65|nr:hypothetical protein [Shewanella sp. AS16]MCE9688263.1 hypothetical protein [Shewanella sp. AS16]
MNGIQAFCLLILFTFDASATELTPLELILGNLKDIKSSTKKIEKWDCPEYQDHFSNFSCEYLKAYSYHSGRKFDKAHEHIKHLYKAMLQKLDIIKAGVTSPERMEESIEYIIEMYSETFSKIENGSVNTVNINNILLELLSKNQLNEAYGSVIISAKIIEIFYRNGSMENINAFYKIIHYNLKDIYISKAKLDANSIPLAYKSILSKLNIGTGNKSKNLNDLNNLKRIRNKIPSSEKVRNLDILIDTYLSSLAGKLTLEKFNMAIKKVEESKGNSNEIKIRLLTINIVYLNNTIPEFERISFAKDLSKVRVRYYQLLAPTNQKTLKNSIINAAELVLKKPSHNSDIDEFIIATYVMHRDLIGAPKHNDPFYINMEKKYSILMKDYVDFTDNTSDEFAAISRIGIIQSKKGILGEGLM